MSGAELRIDPPTPSAAMSDSEAASPPKTDGTEHDDPFLQITHYKRNIFYWSLYDLANTIYSMGVVSLVVVPLIIILSVADKAGIDPADLIDNTVTVTKDQWQDGFTSGQANYALILLIGNLIMAVVSPILGGYADQIKSRKFLLGSITLFCLLFTSLLAYRLEVWWVLIIFLFANLSYQMGLVVYDSMVPFIAKQDDTAKVSGFGVAFGYFGSFIAIGIAIIMAGSLGDFVSSAIEDADGNEIGGEISIGYIPKYFPIVALGFFVLGLPLLLVREARKDKEKRSFKEITSETVDTLRKTTKEMFGFKDTRNFMIGWLLFVDAANTVIAFMSVIILIGLGFDSGMLTTVLAIGIGSAVLLTFPVGWISDKIGPRKGFLMVGTLWSIALIFGIFTNLDINGYETPEFLVYIMAILVGPALGGTWVVQRQMISELSPPDQVSSYFGVANIFGRISSAIAPAAWAFSLWVFTDISDISTSIATRLALVVVGTLMLIGLFFVLRVKDMHAYYVHGARHAGNGIWRLPDGREFPIDEIPSVEELFGSA